MPLLYAFALCPDPPPLGPTNLGSAQTDPSTDLDCLAVHHFLFFLRPARFPAQWALCENPFGLAQLMRRLYASLHAMAVT